MKVLTWGTYDLSKPRVRILLRALRESDVDLSECHFDVWGGTLDKSQIKGFKEKGSFLISWLLAYPRLVWCLFHKPRPDVIFVGYLGQLDVLILWPFAKLLKIPIVWDAYISLYNTVVEDRRLVGSRHLLALLLYAIEWLATRAADKVILDTRAHADYFIEEFSIPRDKTKAIFVGVEPGVFVPTPAPLTDEESFTVLFYGQFIPLHGIGTILEAAGILENDNINWVLIGKGQEEKRISSILDHHPLPNVEWIPWVPYEQLISWIERADVCLGIFDGGGKASRIIPNKVFQILASGKPLITRSSPAIQELIPNDAPGVWLVPPDDAAALAKAVLTARDTNIQLEGLHENIQQVFTIPVVAARLKQVLSIY